MRPVSQRENILFYFYRRGHAFALHWQNKHCVSLNEDYQKISRVSNTLKIFRTLFKKLGHKYQEVKQIPLQVTTVTNPFLALETILNLQPYELFNRSKHHRHKNYTFSPQSIQRFEHYFYFLLL